jgi:hypothetical protein
MLARFFRRVGWLIRHLTTARDNESPSLIRILALLLGGEFVWLAAYAVVIGKQPFDAMAFGGGAAALLAALGAALRISLPANAGNDT